MSSKNEAAKPYLAGLNPAQSEAVLATEGPVLVVAGAGAGKTKTITTRVVHLVASGKDPASILAITFTNKSAAEMRERVGRALREHKDINRPVQLDRMPFVSTFHSLAVSLLREFHREAKVPRYFKILDRDDSKQMIKRALKERGIDPKSVEPGRILSAISRAKGDGLSHEEFSSATDGAYFESLVGDVWETYQSLIRKEGALDFDDLLLTATTFLRANGHIADTLRKRWQYIHVDEYQDTNKVQYDLVELLARGTENVFAVGDMDQTIYTWRGARVRNLMQFQKDFRGVKTILLEENYRSTKTIIAAANEVIKKNVVRIDKTLITNNGVGEPIKVYAAYDEADEANFVAERAEAHIAAGIKPSELAVLFRANFQSRALEEAFLSRDIPYQVVGTRFFQRREIKDIIAYLRLALHPDSAADLTRVINVPTRGIGKLSLLKILAGKEGELPASTRQKIAGFRNIVARIRAKAETEKPSAVIRFAIEASGITSALSKKSDEDRERLENIEELVSLSTRYDAESGLVGLENLITDADLGSDQDEIRDEKNAVRLMTVHAAKGLEFDAVFVTGLEDDLFPHVRLDTGQSQEESEEERRLFYVALTRAKKQLYLTYASVRTIFGQRSVRLPSPFLLDIDESLMENAASDNSLPTHYLT